MPGNGAAVGASYGDLLVTSLLVLGAVCIAAFIAVRVFGRVLATGRAKGRHLLDVVARMPLEPRRSLYVVEVAGKTLLVGTSEMGLSVLSELDGGEVKARVQAQPSFGELVRAAWMRRKGRDAGATSVDVETHAGGDAHVGTADAKRETHVGTADAKRETHVGTTDAKRETHVGTTDAKRETHVGTTDVKRETHVGTTDAKRETHVGANDAKRETHVGTTDAKRETHVGTTDAKRETHVGTTDAKRETHVGANDDGVTDEAGPPRASHLASDA
jgi:flagellar biogenesis protein FliO